MRFVATVNVMPRAGISDPQGQTIEGALPRLGFEGIQAVRVGKRIVFAIEAADEQAAAAVVERACAAFLSNPVIEDFEYFLAAVEPVR